MRSAPAFHDVMVPSSDLLMIASSEEPTMAARTAVAFSLLFRSLMSTSTFTPPITFPNSS